MAKYNILSIDGGGMKGLISAIVIEEIENEIKKQTGNKKSKIADYFHMVAGTSTGAILTAIYLVPDKNGRPRYSASDATELYLDKGKEIFQRSKGQRIKTALGLTGPKYSNQALSNILNMYVGNVKISNLVKPCLITAYDINNGSAFFFDTNSAKKSPGKNYYLKDAVLASSAAPTFFPPVNVSSINGIRKCLIDGGVCCNNPSLCAFTEALKHPNLRTPSDINICAVGNVGNEHTYTCKESQKWGLIGWAMPAINIMMDARKQIEDYELNMLYSACEECNNYLRLEQKVDSTVNLHSMDDTSDTAIRELTKIGKDIINARGEEIEKFVKNII